MSTQIDWQAKREVWYSDEYSTAYVKTAGGFMEFEDYREHGGRVEALPEDARARLVGTFTNAEISNMDYPT